MDNVADANPIAGLTAEQLEALRLVRDGFTSKQIAQRLHISRWAVDQRVDRARARLAAADRAEAARMLSVWERETTHGAGDGRLFFGSSSTSAASDARGGGGCTCERFVREPQPLPEAAGSGNLGASYAGPSTARDNSRVREMPVRFGESGGISLRLAGGAGQRKGSRKPLHTLALIVLATVGLAIVLVALPTLVRNAQDMASVVREYRAKHSQ
jgi:DNA-binding CsgD family transcriptional regulator